ncbi:MAG: ABC transporter permease [Gammaproteobacteria bacterium]|nr:ABC transporter permease [Gammaproteobacteria bacterium]NIR82211.1 ABC transporter permease [Gammaproteobacteria bacterium]NIR90810.1 ABC transporter permease [Gammaproteobacteria bacterium]NIU03361.1 ABC transporter permease [Gammaproteobacteria bacterium]NIV50857.1 cell division protein [Gammaproteobacteria bacterium]
MNTRTRPGPGPARLRVSPRLRPRAWLLRHAQTFVYTLGQLARAPIATAMSAAVIGIALALPAGLYAVLQNVQAVGRSWDGAIQLSLYLKTEVSDEAAARLREELDGRLEFRHVELITRAQALEEYRRLSGFGEVLRVFEDENPLPAVVVAHPHPAYAQPQRLRAVVDELAQRPAVDMAQLDWQWLRRVQALMAVMTRGVWLLGAFLGVGVLLIVGNTIRLGIESRRDEIEITKLFGATDAFVRRPFLYHGLWYGLLGGFIAWGLVSASLLLLQGPVGRLAALYGSDFRFAALDASASAALLAAGALLGLTGSWLAVGRHLDAIEPA